MKIVTVTLGPFATNSHFASQDGSTYILFDAGFQPDELLQAAQDQDMQVAAIFVTHGHGDHICGVEWLRRELRCPLYFPVGDSVLATGEFYGVHYDLPQPDVLVSGGERLGIAGMDVEVLSVPGHSPGHVAYRIGKDLFSGDCIFRGSVGRTDLQHADWAQLHTSLVQLLELPDETTIHPGHGPSTTIGREREENPFLDF